MTPPRPAPNPPRKGLTARTAIVSTYMFANAALLAPALWFLFGAAIDTATRLPEHVISVIAGVLASVPCYLILRAIGRGSFEELPFHIPTVISVMCVPLMFVLLITGLSINRHIAKPQFAIQALWTGIGIAMPLVAVLVGTVRGVRLAMKRRAIRRGIGNVCAHCTYDLSGLPDHTKCPECGGIYRHSGPPMPPT